MTALATPPRWGLIAAEAVPGKFRWEGARPRQISAIGHGKAGNSRMIINSVGRRQVSVGREAGGRLQLTLQVKHRLLAYSDKALRWPVLESSAPRRCEKIAIGSPALPL